MFQGVDHPGCCVRTVLFDITDDNIAEPDEILSLSIVRSLGSNHIPLSYVVQRVNVTIVDDDSECMWYLLSVIIIHIQPCTIILVYVSTLLNTIHTGTIIGFENISVSVQERGAVVLYVAVLGGTLGRDVSVRFSTADHSATGEPYCHLLQKLNVMKVSTCAAVIHYHFSWS